MRAINLSMSLSPGGLYVNIAVAGNENFASSPKTVTSCSKSTLCLKLPRGGDL